MMMTAAQWEERLTNSQYAAAEENLFNEYSEDSEFSGMEVFAAILEYEGIIGYKYWLTSLINNIFEVDLLSKDEEN